MHEGHEGASTVERVGITRSIRFWDTGQGAPWMASVDKTRYGTEYDVLCALLRESREAAGLRQADVASALDLPQSFVSKYESGERRLDLIELRQVCRALGVPLQQVVRAFEERVG